MGVSPCHAQEVWGRDVSTWSLQGFHRYSTDQHWHVPHFEKMLYDQGQLAAMYSRAFQVRLWHPSVGLPLLQAGDDWPGLGSSFKAYSPRYCPSHGHGAIQRSPSSPGVYPEVLHEPMTV